MAEVCRKQVQGGCRCMNSGTQSGDPGTQAHSGCSTLRCSGPDTHLASDRMPSDCSANRLPGIEAILRGMTLDAPVGAALVNTFLGGRACMNAAAVTSRLVHQRCVLQPLAMTVHPAHQHAHNPYLQAPSFDVHTSSMLLPEMRQTLLCGVCRFSLWLYLCVLLYAHKDVRAACVYCSSRVEKHGKAGLMRPGGEDDATGFLRLGGWLGSYAHSTDCWRPVQPQQ